MEVWKTNDFRPQFLRRYDPDQVQRVRVSITHLSQSYWLPVESEFDIGPCGVALKRDFLVACQTEDACLISQSSMLMCIS